jgi:hypothetical protein
VLGLDVGVQEDRRERMRLDGLECVPLAGDAVALDGSEQPGERVLEVLLGRVVGALVQLKGHARGPGALEREGASLNDPSGLFNSSLDGKVRRAIDIKEDDEIDEVALKDLVREAVALNLQGKKPSA